MSAILTKPDAPFAFHVMAEPTGDVHVWQRQKVEALPRRRDKSHLTPVG